MGVIQGGTVFSHVPTVNILCMYICSLTIRKCIPVEGNIKGTDLCTFPIYSGKRLICHRLICQTAYYAAIFLNEFINMYLLYI